MFTDKFWSYFFEIYEAIPRQGPGDSKSTERALRLLPPLTPAQRILDIGCGSGAQTLDLAQATDAQIVAIDNHPAFVTQLMSRAATLGLADRITAQVGDMNDLRFPDGSFDVIWSEGSIFIMGFAEGLSAWRRLLAPGGYMVVSDFCWFHANPPAELKKIFLDGNPDVGDEKARRKAALNNGFRLLGDFALPEAGWWENFYLPLNECLERFRITHAGNPEALEVADQSQREIDLYRKYVGAYGYVFFVMQREEGGA